MNTSTRILILVLVVDAVLFLTQVSFNNVAVWIGAPAPDFFSLTNNSLSEASANGSYVVNTQGLESSFYTITPVVSTESGDWFTDTAKDLKNWLVSNIPGYKYFVAALAAPGVWLAILGAPIEVCFAIGALWVILTIWCFVMLITGREQ
jgi:hypothetical protein